jgi:hypothetical protein
MANEQQSQRIPPKGVELDEAGGETVQVTVTANSKLKFSRSATLTGQKGTDMRRYTTDDGDEVQHQRSQGYKKLAEKLLKK